MHHEIIHCPHCSVDKLLSPDASVLESVEISWELWIPNRLQMRTVCRCCVSKAGGGINNGASAASSWKMLQSLSLWAIVEPNWSVGLSQTLFAYQSKLRLPVLLWLVWTLRLSISLSICHKFLSGPSIPATARIFVVIGWNGHLNVRLLGWIWVKFNLPTFHCQGKCCGLQ